MSDEEEHKENSKKMGMRLMKISLPVFLCFLPLQLFYGVGKHQRGANFAELAFLAFCLGYVFWKYPATQSISSTQGLPKSTRIGVGISFVAALLLAYVPRRG